METLNTCKFGDLARENDLALHRSSTPGEDLPAVSLPRDEPLDGRDTGCETKDSLEKLYENCAI